MNSIFSFNIIQKYSFFPFLAAAWKI